ncbi:methionyl-tRNA formyltransferase [Candidatus Saccharibacteria bacterium]|nr:methionyl-tRNA formyltransferase [Candidatus Saccharibacteria bacterium]
MTRPRPSVVFFGSGPVAAASLRLLAQDFTIEAVVTKPKAPHHRGEVPVLDSAKELGLPVFTAAGKQELDQLFDSKPLSSRLAILIDFGIIVSQKAIDYFPLGIINSHFSILPQWRGADPITFAVLSGQSKTGVSLMLLVAAMDEGPLLAYGEYDMPTDITTPKLTDELIQLSHELLKDAVPKYLAGQLQTVPQTITKQPASYSRKLTKSDGHINWAKPSDQIEREVRAYLDWPKSQAKIFGHDVIITKARVATAQNDGDLVMKCQPGWLEVQELKAPSGRTMSGADFLRGYNKQ